MGMCGLGSGWQSGSSHTLPSQSLTALAPV